MKAKRSRLLVIDASIARAAGGTTHPTSRRCRQMLETVLEVCHRMVVTPEISREWKGHQSRFARAWWVSMTARKKVIFLDVAPDPALRERLAENAPNESAREAVLKDCCLIEGALAGDDTVCSLDERVRTLLSAAAPRVRQIGAIVWVNPDADGERCDEWLRSGAPPEAQRRLDRFGRS